jgi:hypothetical protein
MPFINVPMTNFDCRSAPSSARPPKQSTPQIDYLSKDYLSFRTLILNRLSELMPNWQETHPGDIGIVIAEILAYVADQLSYYQDAVATEAYLGTARQRISMRRHARLLDYTMHEGCNARVWVQFQVSENLTLPQGMRLLTGVTGSTVVKWADTLLTQAQVFETLYETHLSTLLNELYFFGSGSLAVGSTEAQLVWPSDTEVLLKVEDVLLFEEIISPSTGESMDADPSHRQIVRLLSVTSTEAKDSDGNPIHILKIKWQPEDALTFCLCVNTVINNVEKQNVSVARGNLVLADHGHSIKEEPLLPETVSLQEAYRPTLTNHTLTFSVPFVQKAALQQSASASLLQNPRAALPNIVLQQVLKQSNDITTPWYAKADLLDSSRFAQDFVVEVENNLQVRLRFGDGTYGKLPTPSSKFTANYRIGNGTKGNIGAESIAHIVASEIDLSPITQIRNPLPAQGGK